MKIIENASDLAKVISDLRAEGKTVGFVPTMGALHEGHLSLVKRSKESNDVTVISIFVNPTQFNNADDLKKYPRTLEADCTLLETIGGVDIVFAPNVDTMYPADYNYIPIDLGTMDQVMEGKFRPGHFQGVVQVVKRLFDLVNPHNAYFGQKDFQQVAVIRFMVNHFNLPLNIVSCPIIRSEEGLALSSRNARLSEDEKQEALIISQTLYGMMERVDTKTPKELVIWGTDQIKNAGLEVEYIEIVNPNTLESLTDEWVPSTVCCVTAYCGDVRLIDNMVLN